ncbi:MAG: MFS transporter [Scytolyngbya sp. HA4215-MV1]|nr:MFS transporter [Scytolyngbya sp. HA4215-MV1]
MVGGVVAPILPDMVQQLHLNPAMAGNLVSFHCLTIALFSPPLGILADRIGRLRVLVPSLLLYAVFGVAEAFVSDIVPLLLLRGLLGAASGGIAAASLGLLTSLYEGETRTQALGYATSSLTIAGILFPLLGGIVGATHWQWTFGLYAVSIPMAFLASVVLREKRSTSQPRKNKANDKLRQVLQQPQVLFMLLLVALCSVITYAVIIYTPLYLKTAIGAGPVLNGIFLASRAVGAATVSALGTKWLIRRLGSQKMVAVGFLLMALTLLTIPVLNQIGWILSAAIVFGVGLGITLPSLYGCLADLAPEHLRSSLLASGTGAGFLGQFLCPILLAPVVHPHNLTGVFYTTAGIAVIVAIVMLVKEKWGRNPEG